VIPGVDDDHCARGGGVEGLEEGTSRRGGRRPRAR
jgi:hypothetical protein